MATVENNKAKDSPAANAWYRVAVGTSIVAGALSLIVCAVLVSNYFHLKNADVLDSEELLKLKEAVAKNPDDVAAKERFRGLDLRLRKEYYRRMDFAGTGAYLLTAFVICFVVAIKSAFTFRKKLPMPQGGAGEPEEQARAAATARWSVAVVGVVLGGAAVFLAMGPIGETPEETPGQVQPRPSLATAGAFPSEEEINRNWPRFRGPGGLGVSAYTNIPTEWDGKTNKGILWKTPVPLPGKNSPVLWGNRVFVSGADKEKREVYCFDADTGKLLWRKDVGRIPGDSEEVASVMEDTGYAAPTCATDGRRVFAIFANGDLACFDFDGNELWSRNFGMPDNSYGYASSLATDRGILFVLYDQGLADDYNSVLYALDAATGKDVWQAERTVASSWTTPIVIDAGGRRQVITCATPWVLAYDPADGTELWGAEFLLGDVAPSPIFAGGLVFAVNDGAILAAIRPDGDGVVTDTKIVWQAHDGLPDITSPLSDGNLVYLVAAGGLITCYDVADGKKVWEKYLERNYTASPSLVGNRIYLLDMDGVMLMLEAGREFKELGQAELGEECHASPAFADGRIYIRSEGHLYCIGKK